MEQDLKRRLLALKATLARDPLAAASALDAWIAELAPPPPLIHVEGDPAVAILMPTYQRADLIEATLESIWAQTAPDFVLIACDDGSTDGTLEILEAAARRDPRLRVLRNEVNQGRPFTRNRLIYASDAEFILWMDDDDLLHPRALEIYLDAHASAPEVDVFYGDLQIFDHATGEDLTLFKPYDWAGQNRALTAGKLKGCLVPNGGSFIRRAILTGVGGYDLAFARAQDFEIWSRLAHTARFSKLPHTLYRYRKHPGCVSFGDEIDLSYDSVIIRRHLQRHPWSDLFLKQDWTLPDLNGVYLEIAESLRLYEDPYNALRFLQAASAPDPEVEAAIFEAKLVMGVDPSAWIKGVEARAARLAEARRLEAEIEAAIAARSWATARARLARHRAAYQRTAQGSAALAAIFEGEGDLKAAAKAMAAATRLNPLDEGLRARAEALVRRSGAPLDLEAMRARLLTAYQAPQPPPPPPPYGGLISVILLDGAARASVEAQIGVEVEIIEARSDTPRPWASARGDLIALLEPGARLAPDHLARLAALSGPLRVSGVIFEASDGATMRRVVRLDRAALLVEEALPLSACLWAPSALPPLREGPRMGWDVLLQAPWAAATFSGDATCTAPTPVDSAPALMWIYGRHPEGLDVAVSAARAARAAPLGVGLPRLGGGAALVVTLPPDPEAALARLRAVEAATFTPHQLVLVADEAPPALRAALEPWAGRARFALNLRPLGAVKALNQGLALADGACVTLLMGAARLSPGWLGRSQLKALSDAALGLVRPAGHAGAWTLTRAALDRVGGFDTRLSAPAALVDYRRRLGLAGLAILDTDAGVVGAPLAEDEADTALAALWATRAAPFDPQRDQLPIGNEPGFRPDTPPLRVEEAAAINLLVTPPDEGAWRDLLAWLREAPPGDWAIWWRVAPLTGPEALARLASLADELGVAWARLLIIDAPLAPAREAALYVSADAVIVDPRWPNAEVVRRRATDCGRPLCFDASALRAALRGDEGIADGVGGPPRGVA